MSLANIRDAIKTALDEIDGLNVSSTAPDTIALPMAILTLKPTAPVDYDLTSEDGHYVYHFQIEVLVNKGASVAEAQIDLDPYIDPTDSHSIKNAIEAINFGTDASTKRLIGSPAYGAAKFGSTDYMGVRFLVDVWV